MNGRRIKPSMTILQFCGMALRIDAAMHTPLPERVNQYRLVARGNDWDVRFAPKAILDVNGDGFKVR
jgi:hypothetical protein